MFNYYFYLCFFVGMLMVVKGQLARVTSLLPKSVFKRLNLMSLEWVRSSNFCHLTRLYFLLLKIVLLDAEFFLKNLGV